MTTEEKLKYFEESSLEEARKQASAMIEEYKVNLDKVEKEHKATTCLLYTSPSPRDPKTSRMPSSA